MGGFAFAEHIAQEWKRQSGEEHRVDGEKFSTVDGLGYLMTWHSDLGKFHPAVRELLRQGIRGEELLNRIQGLPLVDDWFEEFVEWIVKLHNEYSLAWWAAKLELCMEAEYPGRMHFHAFLSLDPQSIPGRGKVCNVSIPMPRLFYKRIAPNVRTVNLTGRRRTIEYSFSGGFYYVMANKLGSLRSRANRQLYTETRPGV